MSDINPFIVEKYKSVRSKNVQKATVNKELIFGSQVFRKAIEWGKYSGENPFLKTKYKLDKGKKPGILTPRASASDHGSGCLPSGQAVAWLPSLSTRDGASARSGKLKWEDVNLESKVGLDR